MSDSRIGKVSTSSVLDHRAQSVVARQYEAHRSTVPAVVGGALFGVGLLVLLAACSTTRGSAGPAESPAVPPAGAQAQAAPPCPMSDQDDPMCTLNSAFRSAYAQTHAEMLATMDPIILSIFDRVVLLRAGERHEVVTIPDRFHELKSVAHVPLALYLMLVNRTEAELDADTRSTLSSFLGVIGKARESLAARSFSSEQLSRQEQMLDGAREFIDEVLAAGRVTAAALRAYATGTVADIQVNAREAAESQLEVTHATVTAWLREMSQEERDRLVVVVANAHLPRVGSLTNQYFTALVGDPYEGKLDDENVVGHARMIAAEGIYEEGGLLKLLGKHTVDKAVGITFFDDPTRMHRDLLADVTEEWITANFDIGE